MFLKPSINESILLFLFSVSKMKIYYLSICNFYIWYFDVKTEKSQDEWYTGHIICYSCLDDPY